MRITRIMIQTSKANVGTDMVSLKLHALMIWLHSMGASVSIGLAIFGVALFVCCALGCGGSPCKEKDRLFGRQIY